MGLDLTLLPSEDTALGKALLGFWRWWREGLRKAVPHREAAGGDALVISLGERGLRLPGDDAAWAWRPGEPLDAGWLERLAEARAGRPLVIRLDDDRILSKRLRLPALGRDELTAAVGYQLASATPFPPEQLYHGYRVLSRDGNAVEVELIAAPKSFAQPLIDGLEAAGFGPPARLVARDRDDTDLLPRREGGGGRRWRIGWRMPALLLLLLLLAVAMVVPVVKKRAELIRLESELAAARERAAPLLKARDRALKLNKSLREIRAVAEPGRTELEIIERLSELLPDSVWLIELRFAKGRIQLRGEAPHAVDVLERLQNAPEFTDARFLSPVSKNRRNGRENFHIEIRAVAP